MYSTIPSKYACLLNKTQEVKLCATSSDQTTSSTTVNHIDPLLSHPLSYTYKVWYRHTTKFATKNSKHAGAIIGAVKQNVKPSMATLYDSQERVSLSAMCMRDWYEGLERVSVLLSMRKQSEGIVPSGRDSPFAGRVWAIAEAERGGWEIRTIRNTPTSRPIRIPLGEYFTVRSRFVTAHLIEIK